MIKEELGDLHLALDAYKQALEAGEGKLTKEAENRITSAIERISKKMDNE